MSKPILAACPHCGLPVSAGGLVLAKCPKFECEDLRCCLLCGAFKAEQEGHEAAGSGSAVPARVVP